MEAMRESWTDDRLDYLNHRVDDGFKRADERVGRFEKHVDERFAQFEKLVGERLDHADERANERSKLADERLGRLESTVSQLDQGLRELNKSLVSLAMSQRALIVTMALGFLTVLATKF